MRRMMMSSEDKLSTMMMLRLQPRDKERLEQHAAAVGLAPAVFARLAMRLGSGMVRRRLTAPDKEQRNEA